VQSDTLADYGGMTVRIVWLRRTVHVRFASCWCAMIRCTVRRRRCRDGAGAASCTRQPDCRTGWSFWILWIRRWDRPSRPRTFPASRRSTSSLPLNIDIAVILIRLFACSSHQPSSVYIGWLTVTQCRRSHLCQLIWPPRCKHFAALIQKWRQNDLWSRYDLHVVQHDVVLYKLTGEDLSRYLNKTKSVGLRKA